MRVTWRASSETGNNSEAQARRTGLSHNPLITPRLMLNVQPSLRLTATSTSTLWVGSTVTGERVITSDIREGSSTVAPNLVPFGGHSAGIRNW